MSNRKKEIAKFVCGAEAFHAFVHACFWLSGTTLKLVGIKENPKFHRAGAIGNAVVAVIAGIYAWSGTDAGRADDSAQRDSFAVPKD